MEAVNSVSTSIKMTVDGQSSREVQSKKILIVDDDVTLAKFLSRELDMLQFVTAVFHDGEAALEGVQTADFDLVILDMNMPRMDGMEFLRRMRPQRPSLPVLVLTARNATDDFLIKPFSFQELTARIRRLLRRGAEAVPAAPRTEVLVMNEEQHRVTRGARHIELTPREFGILKCLRSHAGKPVTRETLLREVWNASPDDATNIVDVYMKYLRDKIDGEGETKLIRTVRGVGYVLDGAN